jgi:hypothetical protein
VPEGDHELPDLEDLPDALREEAEDYARYANESAAMAYRHSADLLEAVLEKETS